MFDRFIHDLSLRAKSKTGASEEVLLWALAGVILAPTAVVFLSLAAYAWLASIYGSALAWLIVGVAQLVILAGIAARCVSVRRHNRALALAKIELAARQHEGWKLDPTYLAIGIEVVKIVGFRTIIPLVVGGLAAAGWAGSRNSKPNGHAARH
jgi:hypothetical protein